MDELGVFGDVYDDRCDVLYLRKGIGVFIRKMIGLLCF